MRITLIHVVSLTMSWLLRRLSISVLASAACFGLLSVSAAADTRVDLGARQVWQLLDYIAVDYGGAVANGAVISAPEYAEMQEFSAEAERQIAELPGGEASGSLIARAASLRAQVAHKSDPAAVSALARSLASEVQKAFAFRVAPTTAPDLQRGAQLYQSRCASCHGAQGAADGPLAASLNPKPTALSMHSRARERSLFALHQVISNGVQGTAMPGFGALPEADRWALAFFVGTLSYDAADKAAGARLWGSSASLRQAMTGLDALTQTSEAALAERVGEPSARSLTAFLRANPQSLAVQRPRGTALAQAKLAESLAAVRAGDRPGARVLALSAYLDGFEPVEPALATRDRALFLKIEAGMVAYRATVTDAHVDAVQASEQSLQQLLQQADGVLAASANDAVAAFVGALTILLREGLEALLMVVAMIAFLKKAERKDMLIYVHGGWVAALALGGVTWGVATYLVGISGASRELTEGLSSLFAAVVLLGVGMWMHQKSVAGRWQAYLHEKMSGALTRRAAWFLFSLAFIAVYREVFETVLFYAALWSDGNGWPLLGGLVTGVVLLAILAVLLLRTSARLPIGRFFAWSSLLVAVLAVVLAGKGIAGLQEAGWIYTSPIPIPRIDVLGIFPTWQTLVAQLVVLLIVVAVFFRNTRTPSRPFVKRA